ncbi:MAG: hypothetical protein NZ554_14055 [Bryobacteraceae bacterium]|nr:hypothetical protein [Bryobacteraceae bacterium]
MSSRRSGVPGLTELERQRNLQMLRFLSEAAADHGLEFTLGVWEHHGLAAQPPTVVGVMPRNIGPYSYAALKRVLAACPAIRSVQVGTTTGFGLPPEDEVALYRDWVFRAIREAGWRVTLDLRASGLTEGLIGGGSERRGAAARFRRLLGRTSGPALSCVGDTAGLRPTRSAAEAAQL